LINFLNVLEFSSARTQSFYTIIEADLGAL